MGDDAVEEKDASHGARAAMIPRNRTSLSPLEVVGAPSPPCSPRIRNELAAAMDSRSSRRNARGANVATSLARTAAAAASAAKPPAALNGDVTDAAAAEEEEEATTVTDAAAAAADAARADVWEMRDRRLS